MYYTIEGKRFLAVLYIIGLLAGTIFINVAIKTGLFRASDLLGFTEYVNSLDNPDTGTFFSYVLLVRLRQIFLFFICMLLFSPYIVYCVLDFFVSFMVGTFISVMVIRYGWSGMFQGILFLFPHYIFYGLMLVMIYIYLFRKTPPAQIYRVNHGNHGYMAKNSKILEYKVIVALVCLFLFALGCYSEGFISPEIIKYFSLK